MSDYPPSFDFKKYLQIFLRYKLLIIAIVLGITIFSVIYSYMQTPIFLAKGTIRIEDTKNNSILENLSKPITKNLIRTEIEIIKSYRIMDIALKKLQHHFRSNSMIYAMINGINRVSLKDMFRVEQIVNTEVVVISAVSPYPELSKEIVNQITDAFIRLNIKFSQTKATAVKEFITEQIIFIGDQLRVDEDKLLKYKKKENIASINLEGANIINTLAQLETDRMNIKLQIKELDIKLQSLRERVTDKLIDINSDLKVQLRTFKEKEKDLAFEINRQSVLLRKMPKKELDLIRLTRNYKVNENIYTLLLTKHEESRIEEAALVGNVKIIDRPIMPEYPIKPNKKKNVMLGIIIGILLGWGAALVLEYIDTSIRTVEEVEKTLNLSIMATIPLSGKISSVSRINGFIKKLRKDKKKSDREKGAPIFAISKNDTLSPFYRSFIALQNDLQFVNIDKKIHSILMTSSIMGEGKTTIALNFAFVHAKLNKKVLLIDGDMHRPNIHKLMQLERGLGLSDIISGKITSKKAIHKKNIFHLVTAGSSVPNPAEILGSQKFDSFLKDISKGYDMVIMDTPPVIGTSDPAIIGHLFDGVAFVARSAKVDKKVVLRALKKLEEADCKILGCIFNGVSKDNLYGSYIEYNYY